MDRTAFAHMAAVESTHWWFVGRRAVIDGLLDRLDLPLMGEVLEAGCGTGGNLASLSRRGTVAAFEPHLDALERARAHNPDVRIVEGALPERLPFEEASFDLVAALDVLEHVDDHATSARALVRFLRPGGWLIVTVPAHQALWGSHDRRLHHVRRYGRRELIELFDDSDVEVVRVLAFNSILAPIALAYRLAERLFDLDLGNQERVPPEPLNRLLAGLFSIESRLIRRGIDPPFGLSYAVVLRRPREHA